MEINIARLEDLCRGKKEVYEIARHITDTKNNRPLWSSCFRFEVSYQKLERNRLRVQTQGQFRFMTSPTRDDPDFKSCALQEEYALFGALQQYFYHTLPARKASDPNQLIEWEFQSQFNHARGG